MTPSAIVACRLIDPADAARFGQAQLVHLGAEIGKLLKQARRDRKHIVHVFLAWPELAGLLPGAEPWADETIYEASAEQAFGGGKHQHCVQLGHARQVWLCGLISYGDYQIARDFFGAQSVRLQSAPTATRFLDARAQSRVGD